jgi:hypothetical protein
MYDGFGMLFRSDGEVVYQGNFSAGLFSGDGRLAMQNDFIYEGAFRQGAADGFGRLTQNGIVLYSGDFVEGVAEGLGILTDRSSGLIYNGRFESGRISPSTLLSATPAAIYEMFESGMRERLEETKFYLYNADFGLALRFEYADENNPARLCALLMTPDAALPAVGVSTEGIPNDIRSVLYEGFPDSVALTLLRLQPSDGMFPIAIIERTVLVVRWISESGDLIFKTFQKTDDAMAVSERDAIAGRSSAAERDANGGAASGPAAREYYLKFGLYEIAPAA